MTLKVLAPDGTYGTAVAFSTTTTSRFFTGTINSDTADLEVSIRGGGFTSDPAMVSFSAAGWIVPNPTSYPNGLDLFSGENLVEVRSVPLSGVPSAPVTASVYLLASSVVQSIETPTAITVERLDSAVNVSVQGLTDPTVTGYNFYASATAGGGTVGYSRVNAQPVSIPVKKESTVSLYNLTSKNVTQSVVPLYVRALITQENLAQVTLETDVDSAVQIPDTVSQIQVDVSISSLEQTSFFEFLHNRKYNLSSVPSTIPVGSFSVLPSTEPLYYVVTAIFFNPVSQVEYESSYSQEVVASPIDVRISTQSIPAVSRQQILQNSVASIYRKDKDIAVQPGSVVRDTVLDPFSTEAERIRFLLDFIYRASSFDTLLAIDDPTGSGVSIPPASSSYKIALSKALYLANPTLVQTVIDGAFDKLAANFGVTRTPGQRAIGEVRFYTATTPTVTLQAQLGTLLSAGGVSFRSSRIAEIPLDRLASFYNPSTGQYSIIVPAQAVSPGSAGNVGPRQISSGAPFGLSVTNDNAFFGGTNAQSNAELAALARGSLSSVDTGTTQGYYQTAAKVPGLVQAKVVEAGNPLMQRDYDPATGTHIGGKVDVWAQGQRLATVTDVFAFTFIRKRDVQFVVLGDPGALQFQALDPDLSTTNPLTEMLDYPSIGLGLRNATSGLTYNLAGVTYLNYNTIKLSLDVPQPFELPTLTDVILGDYRYRTGEKFVFTRQPVESLTTVVGEASGTLDPSIYSLVHPNSPLALGRSTKAGDYLQITGSADPTLSIPTGTILAVTNESHVIVGEYFEYVLRLGADSLTVKVTNSTGTVTYASPFVSSTPDYTIVEGDQTNPLGIKRTSTSAISDGQTVLISYNYDENFTVTYQTNLITSALQLALDETKHGTADVLGKGGVPVPVDLTATIVLRRGFQQSTVDTRIRTNLGLLIAGLRMGVPLRRSDVVNVLDSVGGVSYVVLPMTKMVRSFGSQVVKDSVNSSQIGDAFRVDLWSDALNSVWLLTDQLTAATTTGGGPVGNFRGVFQDDAAMVLQTSLPAQLREAPGRAFIIGNEGAVIPNYSDDSTLYSQGYITPTDIANRRQAITQNRVMVSLQIGDAPSNHTYWATYTVAFETGEKDIVPSGAEYLTPGVFTFTYSEDKSD
jgi:predicted secreted protein